MTIQINQLGWAREILALPVKDESQLPICRNCRFWIGQHGYDGGWGVCDRDRLAKDTMLFRVACDELDFCVLQTNEDFGCNQFEVKDHE